MRISDWSSDVCSSDLQGLDMTLDGFGRNGLAAVAALDAAREEIFEFIEPACAGQVFIASDAAYRGFMHFDGFGHGFERQRFQMRDAMAEKIFLLFHNLARNLDDRALPLVERLDQPV